VVWQVGVTGVSLRVPVRKSSARIDGLALCKEIFGMAKA
jgi:hypothetical protein